MPFLSEDSWIGIHNFNYEISELDDCSIAVDATYFLSQLLDRPPCHEPLLVALGGFTGVEENIDAALDKWAENNMIPFFVFDGQPLVGQAEVEAQQARLNLIKSEQAWNAYMTNAGPQAVQIFGSTSYAFWIRYLYPCLMAKLKKRGLHYIVAPFNTSAQLAYFDQIDSDQCAAIMGSDELFLYPIRDVIIKHIDFDHKTVFAASKKTILRVQNIDENTLIDAILMRGTSFLPTFPPLQDPVITTRQPFIIVDAINMLRTSQRSITSTCLTFNDVLQAREPDWLDKYRKARMAVHHFIYISEEGEVKVNDYEHLTQDNHLYLGLQMPGELFHYMNTGLIRSKVAGWITQGEGIVLPCLAGSVVEEYKSLVAKKLLPLREQTLALLVPRLNRGILYKDVTMKLWYEPKFSVKLSHRSVQPPPPVLAASWHVKQSTIDEFPVPAGASGLIAYEILSLVNPDFVQKTFSKKGERVRGVNAPGLIASTVIWRFLHLRGYINDDHTHSRWGTALATSLFAVNETVQRFPKAQGLFEAVLLAFELIRFGVLNGQGYAELPEAPLISDRTMDVDRATILLISRCATLLPLQHSSKGYKGPLSRNLLAFNSLAAEVREADRDLLETVAVTHFLYAQATRERDDYLEVSQRLPFLTNRHIGLGVAAKAFFGANDAMEVSAEHRASQLEKFAEACLPYVTNIVEDMRICYEFIGAVSQGVQTLDKEVTVDEKQAWAQVKAYLDARSI